MLTAEMKISQIGQYIILNEKTLRVALIKRKQITMTDLFDLYRINPRWHKTLACCKAALARFHAGRNTEDYLQYTYTVYFKTKFYEKPPFGLPLSTVYFQKFSERTF